MRIKITYVILDLGPRWRALKPILVGNFFFCVGQGEFTKTFITKFSINSAATGGHRGRRRRRRRWRLRISASWPGDGMEVCGTWFERRP